MFSAGWESSGSAGLVWKDAIAVSSVAPLL